MLIWIAINCTGLNRLKWRYKEISSGKLYPSLKRKIGKIYNKHWITQHWWILKYILKERGWQRWWLDLMWNSSETDRIRSSIHPPIFHHVSGCGLWCQQTALSLITLDQDSVCWVCPGPPPIMICRKHITIYRTFIHDLILLVTTQSWGGCPRWG